MSQLGPDAELGLHIHGAWSGTVLPVWDKPGREQEYKHDWLVENKNCLIKE